MYAVSVLRLLDCSHLSRELRIPKGHGSSISFRVDLSLGRVGRNGHWIPRDEPPWYERFRNQSRNWHSGGGAIIFRTVFRWSWWFNTPNTRRNGSSLAWEHDYGLAAVPLWVK